MTAGGYVVLNIVALGLVSIFFRSELTDGSPLARAVCGFIAVSSDIRLIIQLFLFDAKPHLRTRFLTLGFHGLTLVFLYQTLVCGRVVISG